MPIKIKKEIISHMQKPVFDDIYCMREECPYYNDTYDQDCRLFDSNVIFSRDEGNAYIRCLDCFNYFEEK